MRKEKPVLRTRHELALRRGLRAVKVLLEVVSEVEREVDINECACAAYARALRHLIVLAEPLRHAVICEC